MRQSLKVLKLVFLLFFARVGASGDVQPLDATTEDPASGWPCPTADAIAPCVCTWDEEYNLFLDCSAVKTVNELSNAFQAQFPFKNFSGLTIEQSGCTDCALTELPAEVIGSVVTFKDITIMGTQLVSIQENVFSASRDTLTTLRLSSNELQSFPDETLGSYNVLSHIYLNNNNFDSEHPLHRFSSETLTIINLSSNDLTVPPDFITSCPAIKQVRLRNMKETEVPTFSEIPISMFTGLQHIELIDFGANLFTEIQTDTIVAEAATLKTVDFSQNNISIVHPSFVTGFSAESSVNLNMSRNSLLRLDQAVWEGILNEISQESSVDISGNPLLCGCDVAWLVSNPLMSYFTNTTTCDDGTPIQELAEDAFTDC
jgi:hypothetical protein